MAEKSEEARAYNPIKRFGGIRQLENRLKGRSQVLQQNKEAVAAELMSIGFANLTDVVRWDAEGNLQSLPSEEIDDAALRAIKKVKSTVRTDKDGARSVTTEIELHDKVRVLQVLAKASGLLDEADKQPNAPSVVGIKMVGPDVIDAQYEEVTKDGETADIEREGDGEP